MQIYNNTPLISVIIPVYNAEKYLHRCLNSVCRQTLRHIEIICVNDASIDNSLEILNEYAAKDSRMRIVSLEKNSGESVARNTGLAMARGEYIGFVDNDDAVDLDFYKKLYERAKLDHADIVRGRQRVIDYNNKVYMLDEPDILFGFWTAIYSAKYISSREIFFPENLILGGDLVFILQATVNTQNISTVDEVYYIYYKRRDSTNSEILDIEKLYSALNAYNMMIKIMNNAEVNSDIYCYLFLRILFSIPDLSQRCKDIKSKYFTAEIMIKIFNNCKYNNIIKSNIIKSYNIYYNYLISNNTDLLADFLIRYLPLNSITNLREHIKRDFSNLKGSP
jgi:glycosyltransferase involved in cell wall biosynthesis